jgi:hypothetical protein
MTCNVKFRNLGTDGTFSETWGNLGNLETWGQTGRFLKPGNLGNLGTGNLGTDGTFSSF